MSERTAWKLCAPGTRFVRNVLVIFMASHAVREALAASPSSPSPPPRQLFAPPPRFWQQPAAAEPVVGSTTSGGGGSADKPQSLGYQGKVTAAVRAAAASGPHSADEGLPTSKPDADSWWAGQDAISGSSGDAAAGSGVPRLSRQEAAAMQAKLRVAPARANGTAAGGRPETRSSYLDVVQLQYGRWCGGPIGGYQTCCGGGPCSACDASAVTEGQPQASAACLAQCPPQDAMDAACAAHDTCFRWPSVAHYDSASAAQQCGLPLAQDHFCGCDATLFHTVSKINPATLPFQASCPSPPAPLVASKLPVSRTTSGAGWEASSEPSRTDPRLFPVGSRHCLLVRTPSSVRCGSLLVV